MIFTPRADPAEDPTIGRRRPVKASDEPVPLFPQYHVSEADDVAIVPLEDEVPASEEPHRTVDNPLDVEV